MVVVPPANYDPSTRLPLASLKKAELTFELARRGIEFSSRETVVEMRARLSAAYAEDQPVQSPLPKNFHRMRIDELRTLCQKRQIQHTVVDTRGILMLKIRNHVPSDDGDTMIDFGKHIGISYHDVVDADQGYCTWVQKTAALENCDPRLRRFGNWLTSKVGAVNLPDGAPSLQEIRGDPRSAAAPSGSLESKTAV